MPVPLSVALSVGKRGLFLLHEGGERGFDDAEAFVELLVGDHQRNEDANHIVESSSGDGDEAVLVAILGDGFGLGVGRLAGLSIGNHFDGSYGSQTANVADLGP